MTPRGALALALAIVAGSTVTANAQLAPWPSDAPKPPSQTAPWPGDTPAQPMAAPAPGAPMGAPVGAPMGAPMQAAPGGSNQQACIGQFTVYREEFEKRFLAAKAGGEKHVPREEMCKLIGAYAAAATKWAKFTEDNMTKCGIPKDAVSQIKSAHAHAADIRKKVCSAGPAQAGGPPTPSLSDALGTTRLPSQETEKRKPGGTLDTLTGNAIAR